MTYDPRNWFWLAEDKRVFSSSRSTILDEADVSYTQWLDAGHRPSPWPRDDYGIQSDRALQDVLGPSGIYVDLAALKAALKATVDVTAEMERLRYITGGAGQAMTYQRKADEARACLVATSPAPADYPMLAAEIGITAATLAGVAEVVNAAYESWLAIGAQIEVARLGAKAAIDVADTVEAAQAAAEVVWPST